jgi:hypothetical protein
MSGNDRDKKADSADAAGSQSGGGMRLIDKIKQTLSNTPAERWEQAGEELDSNRKYQKPQEQWEQVFCTDTKSGVLVLRKSTPITSNFFGGGYSFVEASEPRYLVELRARGWAPKMLVDPTYRSAGGAERTVQVLAEGSIAKELYYEIQHNVRTYRESLRRGFNDSVERLISNIHEQIQSTAADDWKSVEGNEQGYTGYRADVNGMTVTVSTIVRDRTAGYAMNFQQYGLRWECRDSALCKEIFTIVDESARNASLEQLGKVLDDML